MKFPRLMVLLLTAFLLTGSVASANTAPGATREQVRKELATFFAHIGDHSPAALSGIAKSPEMLKAIDQRIDSMSDAEIADFQKMMKEVPDWQTAPQTITRMLPPEALKQIQKTSADFTARAPEAEKTRNEIGALATVLKMLPDEKLKEMGIDRSMVGSLDLVVNQMSPLQAGVLQQQLSGNQGWQKKSAAAMAAMPPALRRGAVALAKHGPITRDDLKELDEFRAEVTSLLNRVDALPDETKKQLKLEDLRAQIAKLDMVTPEQLFMVRAQMPPDIVQSLSASVTLMERIANISDADKKTLETFRGDLEDVFARGDQAAAIRQKIASLTPGELLLLKDSMPDFDSWKQDTSAYLGALNDPGLAQRITALKQPSPDPALVSSLEGFRVQTLAYIDSVAPSVDPALVATARQAVQHAPLPKLELLRTATENSPGMSPQRRLKIASNISLNCVVSLGSIDLGKVLGSFSLGSIDFNFICNPIADAINAVGGAISTAVAAATTAINNTINTVKAGLQSAITAVTNTVNTLVNGIVTTVSDIWNFVQTIPTLAANAIKSAINLLLDINIGGGLTVRTLISGGIGQVVPKLQTALNLGAGFWNSLNDTLPLLPCPADGTSTPFGTVGTGDAVTKYNRYHFFLDKIVGMIPSDAISLEVKIPAEILYSAWDYLGVCLQDAAGARDSALADTRYTALNTGITNLGAQNGTNTTLLMTQISSSFVQLSSLVNTNDANLTSLINNKAIDLTNLIKQNADDAKQLELRLEIEENLQAGEKEALAAFMLPRANGGYLETVRDVVNNEISSMLAAGQSIGKAQQYFSDALNSIAGGHFKDAYQSFGKAYRELTKNDGHGNHN